MQTETTFGTTQLLYLRGQSTIRSRAMQASRGNRQKIEASTGGGGYRLLINSRGVVTLRHRIHGVYFHLDFVFYLIRVLIAFDIPLMVRFPYELNL